MAGVVQDGVVQDQQQVAAHVGRVVGLCARHHQHVVQLGAVQVVGVAAVDGVRLWQRLLPVFERRDIRRSSHLRSAM